MRQRTFGGTQVKPLQPWGGSGSSPTFKSLRLVHGTITSDVNTLFASVTWNNAAVLFDAIELDVTDTASDANSALLRLRVGGLSQFTVTKGGTVLFGGDLSAGTARLIGFASRSQVSSPADGRLLVTNNAGNNFALFQIGGVSSSFPALKRNGAELQCVLADDSAFAGFQVSYLEANDIYLSTFLEGVEIADPAAPAANRARVYVRDNGAAKTQLVVRFPTGAVQVIATEP